MTGIYYYFHLKISTVLTHYFSPSLQFQKSILIHSIHVIHTNLLLWYQFFFGLFYSAIRLVIPLCQLTSLASHALLNITKPSEVFLLICSLLDFSLLFHRLIFAYHIMCSSLSIYFTLAASTRHFVVAFMCISYIHHSHRTFTSLHCRPP